MYVSFAVPSLLTLLLYVGSRSAPGVPSRNQRRMRTRSELTRVRPTTTVGQNYTVVGHAVVADMSCTQAYPPLMAYPTVQRRHRSLTMGQSIGSVCRFIIINSVRHDGSVLWTLPPSPTNRGRWCFDFKMILVDFKMILVLDDFDRSCTWHGTFRGSYWTEGYPGKGWTLQRCTVLPVGC